MEQTISPSSFSPPQYSEEYSLFFTSKSPLEDRSGNDTQNSTSGISEEPIGDLVKTDTAWTKEKDEYLCALESTYKNKWACIASIMAIRFPGFTPDRKRCKERGDSLARLRLNKGDLSGEQIVDAGVEVFERDAPGTKITPAVDDRVKNSTKRRFDETSIPAEVNPTLKKRKIIWTSERDQFLHSLVLKNGRKWSLIAEEMAKQFDDCSFNARRCGERWDNNINPELNKGPWTIEEKALINEKFKIYGKSWKSYQDDFPDRSLSAIKNIWVSMNRSFSQKKSSTIVASILPEKSMSHDI